MVLKKAKHNVNSGNTFHFGKQLQNQVRYGKDQNVIIKTFPSRANDTDTEHSVKINKKILDEARTYIQDGGLEHQYSHRQLINPWLVRNQESPIQYSLNKRKRWLIPEQVKECVTHKKLEDTINSFRVSLVERKTMKTCKNWESRFDIQNDCISYYDTKWHDGKVKPKKKYSFEADLKVKGKERDKKHKQTPNKKNDRRRRTQHSRGVQRRSQIPGTDMELDEEDNNDWMRRYHPIEEDEDDTPEIHYEVCYARPLTAHRFHRDRHDMESKLSAYSWNKNGKTKKALKKIKCMRNMREFQHYDETDKGYQELVTDWNKGIHWDQTEDDMDSDIDNYDDLPPASMSNKVTVCDYITNSLKPRQVTNHIQEKPRNHYTPNKAASIAVRSYGKNNAILNNTRETLEQEVVKKPTESGPLEVPVLPNPIFISVSADDVSPESLRASYGDLYTEAASLPRLFSLGLTEHCDTSPAIAAVLCHVQEMESDEHVNVGLTLHTNGDENQEKAVCSNKENIPVSLADFIEKSRRTHSPNAGNTKPTHMDAISKEHQYSMGNLEKLRHICGWETRKVSMNEACDLIKELLQMPATDQHQKPLLRKLIRSLSEAAEDADFEVIPSIYCDICYEPIYSENMDSHSGMALKFCNHWFCRGCWQQHLVSRIRQGDLEITCPGHQCKSVVDEVTLRSLTAYSQYRELILRRKEAMIETSKHIQWCPNVKCQRLIYTRVTAEVDATIGPCVECECRNQWCGLCLEKPHWPATCDQAKTYTKLLQQNDLTYFAEVKKCPNCKHPMEKNGGCQHMSCRCGHSFCWECLAAWHLHTGYGANFCPKSHKETTVIELDNTTRLSLPIAYYNLSVTHRKARLRWNWRKYMIGIRTQARRAKFGHGGCYQNFENSYEDEKTTTLTAAKFAFEMRFLLEHVCVVMSNVPFRLKSRKLLELVYQLGFIVSTVEQILLGTNNISCEKIITTLNNLIKEGSTCVSIIIPRVRIIQKKLQRRTIQPLEKRMKGFATNVY